MDDSAKGLRGASDDDPLLELDGRGRVSVARLAGQHRRFVLTVDEGQILLTPAVVVSARHPLAEPLQQALTGDEPVFAQLDARGRISLRKLAGGHRRFLATAQDTGQILLTPVTIVAADHPIFDQLELAGRVGLGRLRRQ